MLKENLQRRVKDIHSLADLVPVVNEIWEVLLPAYMQTMLLRVVRKQRFYCTYRPATHLRENNYYTLMSVLHLHTQQRCT